MRKGQKNCKQSSLSQKGKGGEDQNRLVGKTANRKGKEGGEENDLGNEKGDGKSNLHCAEKGKSHWYGNYFTSQKYKEITPLT